MGTRTPREHVEEIRRVKFSIGGEANPLREDLHQAVKNLSAELYAKDVHFLMELIQNAEDNEYPPEVKPSLEFIITSKDITETGATSTLLIFNNEKGFFERNIESICSVGRSTKKGNRQRGYIGEKGIGFKSIFLITSHPYIFSNGYQIRFNEQPLPDCDIGYIVPEWVEKNPTLTDIHQIYGFDKTLPTTTIVLPLKLDKVGAVKQQLSSIHPEVLLFLSKIKQLSVREHNNDPSLNTINAISISSETNFTTRKNIDAESFTLHLCADESDEGQEKECAYYMWRQKFPVRLENRVDRRMEVEEWVITLAFPFGQRLDRGMTSPGIYAFLPTEMVTNFPFIIQADFILASSRENILMDNKWNIGILDCVPSAFTSAFVSLVKATESAPASSLPPIFQFLPLKSSSYLSLNHVRDAIKKKVVAEYIIPCESYTQQKIFCKPDEVGRLMPSFWDILTEARVQGVQLHNLSSHGIYILNSVFDQAKYNDILDYLGVQSVSDEWYVRCIESSNLVLGISEKLYLELLCFLADNWNCHFRNTGIKRISLLKYVDQNGKLALWSINSVTESINSPYICLSSVPDHASWLINWNLEFRCAANRHFIPRSTQEALNVFPKGATIKEWLKQQAIMETLTVYSYADLLAKALRGDRKLVIAFTHFLFHSLKRKYLSEWEVSQLCDSMPLVDNYGHVTTQRKGVLVPANNSKWVRLLCSNPWTGENYVELGEDYLRAGQFASLQTGEKELMQFLATHVKASDIPDLCPPNANFHTVSSPLTKGNTFLLLEWIKRLKYKGVRMPDRFLQCIKSGSWLKTSVGYKPPSQSFLSSLKWGNLLQVGSIMVDIPLIDQVFYDNKIHLYNEELKTIGVMFEYGEACNYIGNRLMTLSSSYGLTKGNVLSMLNFIRFLREKLLSPQDFINSIKEGSWLKTTSHGFRSPVGSILFDSEWKFASEISNLPFIDKEYYGEEILSYRTELQLLGVVVGFNQNYQLVADHFRLPSSFSLMAADSVLLMLRCIRHSRSSRQLISKLQDKKWVKTNSGYRLPSESFLFNNEWGCILEIFDGFPLIDESFYGSNIRLYTDELKELGVVVGLQDASKAITRRFKEASKSISRENVFALLDCYRSLKSTGHHFSSDLSKCIRDEEWLRTRLGYKSPKDSILFDAEWEPISLIASLPFIDGVDGYYGNRICEYRDELKQFGAVVEFKEGYNFVATCLNIRSPNDVTPTAALSLLKCVRNMLEKSSILPKDFILRINKKWLKTVMGFRSPSECILFDSSWNSYLQREDGPFIDEAFYGAEISSYRNELKAVGVVLEVENGCSLLAAHIKCHSHFDAISRIYRYLYKFNWTPDKMDGHSIWIPHGNDKGEWVNSDSCVLHDKDNLFSSQLNVLDKHYEKFLSFFSMAFGVRANPNIDDYCKLWNHWENVYSQFTRAECCAFWVHVAKHWNSKTEKLVSGSVKKLPVNMGSGGIVLVNKEDVFIPDDLQLKDLFDKASKESMFAWYPQPSLPPLSQSKIYEIFDSIGVRTISESVQKIEPSKSNGFDVKKVEPKDALIRNGLFKILLAFLTDPSLEMPAEKRHLIAKQLHDVVVYESDEPITVDYSLHLSSGKILSVKASRMIRWDRDNSKLLTQKVDRSSGYKTMIEFSTYFCEVISEGLLWDKPDRVGELSELIKLGCLLEFDEDAVDFLLKTKNLQLFVEDEEFLISTLSSD